MNKRYYKLLCMLCVSICGYAFADGVNASAPSNKDKISVNGLQIINRIVAFVNKSVITSKEVDEGVKQTIYNFQEKNIATPPLNTLKHQVLEQLIMQKIQLDMAKNAGIKTSDVETNDAISNILKQQKISLEELKIKLIKSGITYSDFRRQVQDQLTIEKLKQREIGGRVSISENEVDRILSSELYKHKIEYDLSDIVVNIPDHASDDIIKQKKVIINAAYNALKTGQPFTQIVMKYSDGQNALSGGDLGWRSNLALPPIIVKELEDLPIGGFTNVIQLPSGLFIFKINKTRKYGEAQIVKQYHVRHILIKVNETRSSDEAYDKIMSIKRLLNEDTGNLAKLNQDFVKYAKEYSEDTSSINGGDLNWVSKGDTVPAFESAMLNTPVNTVSQPIHSPFGWHLLEVVGIRDSNLASDREKDEIRQELRASKANLIYEQWLRDIRDAAYVKINQ